MKKAKDPSSLLLEIYRDDPVYASMAYNKSLRQVKLAVIKNLASHWDYVGSYCSPTGSFHRYPLETCDAYGFYNRVPRFVLNNFARQSMRAVGGGAYSFALNSESLVRVSGGVTSLHNYMLAYEGASSTMSYPTLWKWSDPDTVGVELFGEKRISLMPVDDVLKEYRLNITASTGIAFKGYGANYSRKDYLFANAANMHDLLIAWHTHESSPFTQWRFPWGIATRGKLDSLDSIIEKLTAGKPVSRLISVGHPCEHYLSFRLYNSVSSRVMELVRSGINHPICIGIRKHAHDWRLLGQRLSEYDYTLCADWSRFDTTIGADLLMYAWDVICSRIDTPTIADKHYLHNLTSFFHNNVVHSRYIFDNNVYDISGGIPSGSIWTSLVGSVVNYIVLRFICGKLNYMNDPKIYVYGDDTVIGFNCRTMVLRSGRKKKLLHDTSDRSKVNLAAMKFTFAKTALEHFGMVCSLDDTIICFKEDFRVGVSVPVYPSGMASKLLRRGTRNIPPKSWMYREDPFFTPDYNAGITHRWYYNFENRPSFLKRYWDTWFRPIASAEYTITRLLNSEKKCRNVSAYSELLLALICDNIHNHHVVNYGFHLFYDIPWLRDMCVINGSGALADERFDLFNWNSEYAKHFHDVVSSVDALHDPRMFYRRVEGHIDVRVHDLSYRRYELYMDELRRRTGIHDIWVEFDVSCIPSLNEARRVHETFLYDAYVTGLDVVCDTMHASNAQSWVNWVDSRLDDGELYADNYTVVDRAKAINASSSYQHYFSIVKDSSFLTSIDYTINLAACHWFPQFLSVIYTPAYSHLFSETLSKSKMPFFFHRVMDVVSHPECVVPNLIYDDYKLHVIARIEFLVCNPTLYIHSAFLLHDDRDFIKNALKNAYELFELAWFYADPMEIHGFSSETRIEAHKISTLFRDFIRTHYHTFQWYRKTKYVSNQSVSDFFRVCEEHLACVHKLACFNLFGDFPV